MKRPTSQPSLSKPQPPETNLVGSRYFQWGCLALILFLTAAMRWPFLGVALERDEGEYAYAGQLLLQGVPPYRLAYNMKLPGTYGAYAAIMALFGETARGIHLGLLVVNVATIVLVFLLARQFLKVGPSLVACATYALLSLSPSVLGTAAHATHFVVFFATSGLLLLVKNESAKKRSCDFRSGLLLGLAFLMKQPGIFFTVFGAVWIWQSERQTKPFQTKPFLLRLSIFAAGAALPFLATCVWLLIVGVFPKFWFWTFTYARAYGNVASLSEGWSALKAFFVEFLRRDLWLWVLAGGGFLFLFRDRNRSRMFFLIGLSAASILATSVGLYFRQHYFILCLPAVALLIALFIEAGSDIPQRGTVLVHLPLIIWCGATALMIFELGPVFRWSNEKFSRDVYRGNPFVESKIVADYIRTHSTPEDRVAVLGSEPQIYFYSKRRSATGYIYVYPLMEKQPFAHQMQQEMISEIETAKPEFLVAAQVPFSWVRMASSDTMILDWSSSYIPMNYSCVAYVQTFADGRQVVRLDENAAQPPLGADQSLELWKRKSPLP